jgi:malate dehydrogenase (quinone)
MTAHHCYHGMEYTEDRRRITDWVSLVMEGRTNDGPVAATRIVTGTDVDYGSLTNHLVDHQDALHGFTVHYLSRVTGISREEDGRWRIEVEDTRSGDLRSVTTKFVFIGAGGGALPLLQKSGIPEGKRDMAAFLSVASGCGATTPTSTSAIIRRSMEKPVSGRHPCQCHTSTLV